MPIADCQHENYDEYMDGSGVCLDCGQVLDAPEDEA